MSLRPFSLPTTSSLSQDTKNKIDDKIKAPLISHVCETMRWGELNLALITIASCALACLTMSKAPYPRLIWDAAESSAAIPACISALKTLGPHFDTPVKDALSNICKNNKELTQQAIKKGAKFLEGGGGGASPPKKK